MNAAAGLRDAAERADRHEAALRRIAEWKKYHYHGEQVLTDYECGANDAIDTLAEIAREAL